MSFRRALTVGAAGVAGVGLAVALDRALEARAGELEPRLSGDQHVYRWRGIDVAYSEAGDPDDPTLVLLHGINAAGTNGEFRSVFDALAEEYHVVAPDLPGFGRSDRPPLRYSAALYEDFVADFVSQYDRPAVLASSLTSAYVAASAPDLDLAALVCVCPTAAGGPEPKLWLRELLRSPILGELAFDAITSKPSIRYFNADHGYYDPEKATGDWTDYEWRTAHQPGARYAPASFVSGYLNSAVDLGDALAELDCPVTFLWGREADITPLSDGRDLADRADARLVVFDDAKLLPHVEFPEQFADTVLGELNRAFA
ncbi:alpha/beta fold hydrolase [Halobium salinum]|uniref:Alpha/beta fold hydrolase n=1 Tax=Halobium salinum TaxID=1364940 RepID=A0ABD5PDM7_9EURY|nr:alpha/beta hydrolase [Halobium salinum]